MTGQSEAARLRLQLSRSICTGSNAAGSRSLSCGYLRVCGTRLDFRSGSGPVQECVSKCTAVVTFYREVPRARLYRCGRVVLGESYDSALSQTSEEGGALFSYAARSWPAGGADLSYIAF